MWLLDPDDVERSFPRPVDPPLVGDGRHRLERTIRAELDEELLETNHRARSRPLAAGPNRRGALKIVADRGIESLEILHLE